MPNPSLGRTTRAKSLNRQECQHTEVNSDRSHIRRLRLRRCAIYMYRAPACPTDMSLQRLPTRERQRICCLSDLSIGPTSVHWAPTQVLLGHLKQRSNDAPAVLRGVRLSLGNNSPRDTVGSVCTSRQPRRPVNLLANVRSMGLPRKLLASASHGNLEIRGGSPARGGQGCDRRLLRSTSHLMRSVPGFVNLAPQEVRHNPSLEPTRYGRRRLAAPDNRGHCRSAASRHLPPWSAQLER